MMKKLAVGLLALAAVFSAQAADRIVVAGGSLSELIYALGAGNQVVGVDETTSYPPETAALPHIGYWKQLSSEGILSLRPNRFITWQDAGPQLVFDQLRSQHVEVLTLPRIPATVEQMFANIHTLANALGREDSGTALVGDIRQRLEKVAQSSASKPAPVNARNVAQHPQYRSYSAEALIAANPEVIIVTAQMVNGDLNRLSAIAGITRTNAWKNQRIVVIDQALILGMGPRVADAVETLHRQFWPH